MTDMTQDVSPLDILVDDIIEIMGTFYRGQEQIDVTKRRLVQAINPQIKALFKELVGEDDEVPYEEGGAWGRKIVAHNQLRAELRERIEEL